MYANTFEPYRQFYQENESLDLEAIRKEEHGMVTMALIWPGSKFQLRGALSPFPSPPLPPHPCSHESPVGACSQAMH